MLGKHSASQLSWIPSPGLLCFEIEPQGMVRPDLKLKYHVQRNTVAKTQSLHMRVEATQKQARRRHLRHFFWPFSPPGACACLTVMFPDAASVSQLVLHCQSQEGSGKCQDSKASWKLDKTSAFTSCLIWLPGHT